MSVELILKCISWVTLDHLRQEHICIWATTLMMKNLVVWIYSFNVCAITSCLKCIINYKQLRFVQIQKLIESWIIWSVFLEGNVSQEWRGKRWKPFIVRCVVSISMQFQQQIQQWRKHVSLPDRDIVVVDRIHWLEGSFHGHLVQDWPLLYIVVRGGWGVWGESHLCVACNATLQVAALLTLEGVEWAHGVEEAVVQHHTRQACKEYMTK